MNKASTEPNGYKPIDPARFGRFPTPERERLDRLGKQAMTLKKPETDDYITKHTNSQADLVGQVKDKLQRDGIARSTFAKAIRTDWNSVSDWLDGTKVYGDKVTSRIRHWLDGPVQCESAKRDDDNQKHGPIEVPVRRFDAADRLAVLLNISRDEALNRILETVEPKAIAIEWHRKQIEALEAI